MGYSLTARRLPTSRWTRPGTRSSWTSGPKHALAPRSSLPRGSPARQGRNGPGRRSRPAIARCAAGRGRRFSASMRIRSVPPTAETFALVSARRNALPGPRLRAEAGSGRDERARRTHRGASDVQGADRRQPRPSVYVYDFTEGRATSKARRELKTMLGLTAYPPPPSYGIAMVFTGYPPASSADHSALNGRAATRGLSGLGHVGMPTGLRYRTTPASQPVRHGHSERYKTDPFATPSDLG